MKKFIQLTFALLLLSATSLVAQKYGHLNSGNLLEALPKVKAADQELATYQKQLVSKGETMAQKWEADYKALEAKVQTMAPVELQKAEAKLKTERDNIMKYEQEVSQLLQQKRQELLDPILKEVDDALKAVGKENSYTMIFDSSIPNAILFLEDSDDVMPLVMAKLGIQ